jgi:hypothetical protein
MGVGDEEAIALAIKQRGDKPVDRLIIEIRDADIEGEIIEPAQDLLGRMRQDGEIDARMLFLHGAGEKGSHGERRWHDADHQFAGQGLLAAADLAKLLLHRVPVVEDGMGPFENPFALRRQAVIALAALDDRHAQFLLELAQAA